MTRRLLLLLCWVLALPFAADAAAAEKLSIGALRLPSSGPVFIAMARGYFAAEGLDAELRFFDAAQPVAVATVAGDVDIGVTGLTAGFYNLAGKGALRIIGAQSREEPGYHLVAYLASSKAYAGGLTELKDLAGHSVAITQVGSTFHYSVGLLAEKLGFPITQVKLVPLQSMGTIAAALKGNQVDAGLIPATVALPLIGDGSAHLLGWVGDETPWQLGAIFATATTLRNRRPAVEAFLRAYRHAAHDYHDAFLVKGADGKPTPGADAEVLLAIMAKATGRSEAQIRAAIPYVDPDAKLLIGDIYRQVAWYQSQGLVEQSVDAKTILDPAFVGEPAAH
ncbi:MAG TPA: ABC transporter substrate-binding protein [Stellaceae bacterium]|nr:ABC transporter substrate-binding protein [Stellaceae bacterium]